MVRPGWGTTCNSGHELTRGCYALEQKYHLPSPPPSPFKNFPQNTCLEVISAMRRSFYALYVRVWSLPPPFVAAPGPPQPPPPPRKWSESGKESTYGPMLRSPPPMPIITSLMPEHRPTSVNLLKFLSEIDETHTPCITSQVGFSHAELLHPDRVGNTSGYTIDKYRSQCSQASRTKRSTSWTGLSVKVVGSSKSPICILVAWNAVSDPPVSIHSVPLCM